MNPRGIITITILGTFAVSADVAVALNETTHAVINEQAARQSQLNPVLIGQLGFPQGIEQALAGRQVFEWLREGGIREDDGGLLSLLTGKARFLRHFHDPLEAWDRAGLFGLFESSLRWMQNHDQAGQAVGENWAWPRARDLYYLALASEGKDDRERAFADLFRALGQVMHLVVDASVPEHVRNDDHAMESACRSVGITCYGNYEYWVSDRHGRSGSPDERAFIATYLATPARPDPALLREPTDDRLAPVPVARLIDSDTYQGLATGPNVTLSSAIGLAEVANANFFSEDTAENNRLNRQYPFPVVKALLLSEHPAPKTGRVRAYRTKGPGDGLSVDPVLAECALDEADPDSDTVRCTDENVWAQVAKAMLPRAVGYSAALLDYFFRGRLEARVENGTLEVVNASDELLGPGTLALYYDDQTDTRRWMGDWAIGRLEPEARLSLSVIAPPGPTGYVLVYRGALGGEADAVVGKVIQPMPYLFFEQLSYTSLAIEQDPWSFIDWCGNFFYYTASWPTSVRITGWLHTSPGVEVLKFEVAPAEASDVAYDRNSRSVTIHFAPRFLQPVALIITTDNPVPNPQGFDYPFPNKDVYSQPAGPDDFFPIEGTGSQRATTLYFPLAFPGYLETYGSRIPASCSTQPGESQTYRYIVHGDFSEAPVEGTHRLKTDGYTEYAWERLDERPQYSRLGAVVEWYIDDGVVDPPGAPTEPRVTVEHYYKYFEEKGPEELKAVLPRSSFAVNLLE